MGKPSSGRESYGKGDRASISILEDGDARLVVCLDGTWTAKAYEAARKQLKDYLKQSEREWTVTFRTSTGGDVTPAMAADLLDLSRMAEAEGAKVDAAKLPGSLQKLLCLARPDNQQKPESAQEYGYFERVGRQTVAVLKSSQVFIEFLGEFTYSAGRLLRGKARFRKRDFWVTLQECGVDALPIVSLLAILTGTILGFVGAVQLRKFGATIYMTDLVGLAMAREMGCLMTGIIMSGRTGASFAAQIGTMKVNQEIDALRTIGLSPVEFLVLPRSLALVLMIPMLTLYANLLGWTGGFLVSLPMGINPAEYWQQLTSSLSLNHILFGLSKSFFFGIVIAVSGCYYGLIAQRNSAAVGQATTKAVVAGITWIVVLDAIFAFMDEILSW